GISFEKNEMKKLNSPIGLDIGAESPEEIAISILGEIIAFKNHHPAGFLHDSEKIHMSYIRVVRWMNHQVNSIIFRAGSAQRMGQTKQLLTLRDKVLLHHVIDQVRQVNFEKINTVIGHDANEIQRIIRINDSRFHWITNNAYKKGISTSLKKGLQYCSKHPHHIMFF